MPILSLINVKPGTVAGKRSRPGWCRARTIAERQAIAGQARSARECAGQEVARRKLVTAIVLAIIILLAIVQFDPSLLFG
jgi:hypothetical protein